MKEFEPVNPEVRLELGDVFTIEGEYRPEWFHWIKEQLRRWGYLGPRQLQTYFVTAVHKKV